jgi:hypothetical protein
MEIRVNTMKYRAAHGHMPQQPRGYQTSRWAFQIDNHQDPVFIAASYEEALAQAKTRAEYSVTVLP